MNLKIKDISTSKISAALAAGILLFTVGYFAGSTQNQAQTEPASATRHMGRTTFTNPLIDLAGTNESTRGFDELRKKLEVKIDEFLERKSVYALSVYYQDLETGKWFGINETETYAPASLMKVTLLVAFYKLAESSPALLEGTIVNDGSYTEQSNVPPSQRLALGKEYTVNDLLRHMIVNSNNEAQYLLSDHLEKRVTPETNLRLIKETMTLIPASYELGDVYELTPIDYAGIFRILYNATYLSESMSEKALSLLSESSFDSGIVNGLPENITTANKFGFKNDSDYVDQMQFHDCGIIYAEPSPYILCVMTKTDDPVAAQEAVSEISTEIYSSLFE